VGNTSITVSFRLPYVEQNALAKWVLDELRSEKAWMKAFAAQDILENLADEAIAEKRKETA
jgi:hypothetical protein